MWESMTNRSYRLKSDSAMRTFPWANPHLLSTWTMYVGMNTASALNKSKNLPVNVKSDAT